MTGFFDPLLAGHARRLNEIADSGGVVVVLVADPPRPILPARARAELVAALAAVHYVIVSGGATPESWIERLGPDLVFREEAADERRTQDLIGHVHRRHEAS